MPAASPKAGADRRAAITNARAWEARARLSNKEERNMRAILIPALAALGIALAGTSATMAAPANGEVIGQAAYANQAVQPVYWRHYYRWHGWRHRYHHRWWW
jgi:hypothetical protein